MADYPTIENVYFPFHKPYEVQRALMETMLEALKPDDDDERRKQKQRNNNNNSITSPNEKKRKAKIIFLESPTGTGKSLSLGKFEKNSKKTHQ
jgi:Rad3-related DNA helicase